MDDNSWMRATTAARQSRQRSSRFLLVLGAAVMLIVIRAALFIEGAGIVQLAMASGDKPQYPATGDTERSKISQERATIAAALKLASAESGVPLPILQGLAFVQSRWSQIVPTGPTDIPPSWGVMGLRDSLGNTLLEAASLIGAPPQTLKTDLTSNIRGTAALLASWANTQGWAVEPVSERLESWEPVLARFSGLRNTVLVKHWTTRVYGVIHQGYHGDGIEIDSHPSLDTKVWMPQPFSEVARMALASGPPKGQLGYPKADWCGPDSLLPDSACPATGHYQVCRNGLCNGQGISKVVIHTIQGTAECALEIFTSKLSTCDDMSCATSCRAGSANYIITAKGEVWQVVGDQDTAFHAGNLSYNQQSIGIELEDNNQTDSGDQSWQTDAQYKALEDLVTWLRSQYPIPLDREHIIGHNNVPSPGPAAKAACAPVSQWGGCDNHHDPGAWWNWRRFMTDLGHHPNFSVDVAGTQCSVLALPEPDAPEVTSLWQGQRFVTYDSLNGYDLIFLSGMETPQLYLTAGGEFHWDGWVPQTCVNAGPLASQLEVGRAFPSTLNIRNNPLDSSTNSVIGRTIDGKRYVATGTTKIGFDKNTWYQYDIASNTQLTRGWSSGGYLSPVAAATPTRTPTGTRTPTPTKALPPTPTKTPSPAATRTPSPTPTRTPSRIPTKTPTRTASKTPTRTASKTPTRTPSKTSTRTATKTPTRTPSNIPTQTPTRTPTRTASKTAARTPTRTATRTATPAPTKTR